MCVYSVTQSRLTLGDSMVACEALLSMEFFSVKNTGVCCHLLLQAIFLTTQGSNLHLLRLLHWQADASLSHLGCPRYSD